MNGKHTKDQEDIMDLMKKLIIGFTAGLYMVLWTCPAIGADEQAAADAQIAAEQSFLNEVTFDKTVEQDKRAFLSENYFEAGTRQFEELRYEKAYESFENALKLNPAHEGARSSLQETAAILGIRRDKVLETAERLSQEKHVKVEQQLLDIEYQIGLARQKLNEKDYDTARAKAESIATICRWMPYNVDVSVFLREAEAIAKAAIEGKKRLDREIAAENREAALERADHEALMIEDNLQNRVDKLLAEARQYYKKQDYDKARQLAEKILRDIDPDNQDAQDLIYRTRMEQIASLKHEMRETMLWERKEAVQDVWEAEIPWHDLVKYPENWREVSERKAPSFKAGKEGDEPWAERIKQKMNTRVSFDFANTGLEEVIDFMQTLTDINMILDPAVFEEGGNTEITLRVQDMQVSNAIQWIMRLTGLKYRLRDHAIFISTKERIQDKPDLVIYDVRDLIGQVPNFPGPDLRLDVEGEESAIVDMGDEDTALGGEDLVDFIQQNIAPDSWDSINATDPITFRGGNLLVVQTPENHALIQEMLNNFRQFRALQVSIEARFLTMRDSFLEEIGVDWRGLGEQRTVNQTGNDVAASGNAPAGMEQEDSEVDLPEFGNGTPVDAGFLTNADDTNNAQDIRGAINGVIDRTNLRELSSFPLTSLGGFGMQYAFLGGFQMQMLLHAVEKSADVTLLNAPRLTCFNTQRAHVLIAMEQPYIQDLEVTAGDRSTAADPVIGSFQTGTVLDVRPTVSSDRRYITVDVSAGVSHLVQLRTLDIEVGGAGSAAASLESTIQLPHLTLERIKTTVALPDGGTVALGGIMEAEDVNHISTIPFLGRIPVVNYFFSDKYESSHKKNLMLLLKAQLIILEEQEALL